jgi:hypothetical protein
MTGVQEYKEAVIETPQEQGPGRSPTFRVLAIMIAAIVAIGFAWLILRDSGDETPIEDSVVSSTINSTDEALVGTNVELPFGRFENRDSGLRIVVLHEDGTYTFNNQGFAINGTYELDGDLFTVLTEDIDPEADSGTYRWSYEDGILKFNVIEDAHRWRYAFITYPWVLTE